MTKENCYQLGKITKTHGIHGELVFFLDVDAPQEYEELESVLIQVRGELVPYFIESITINRDRAIVALEDVETIEAAQKLVNCDLYLPLESLEALDETAFYFHEIIGFRVRDEQAGELGIVKAVYSMAAQDLIAMDYEGHEILIPSNSSIVKTVNRAEKVLNVDLPEGLLDVYLDEYADQSDQPHGDEEDDDTDETRFPDED